MSGLIAKGSVHLKDLTVDVKDVRSVELCAANAWPASNVTSLQGWTLRHSPGVSNRRANSVLPLHYDGSACLTEILDDVESFYHRHDLPSRFMVSPASMPEDIDDQLERHGYGIDAPTFVQWGDTRNVLKACPNIVRVEHINAPTAAWMAAYMEGVQDEQEIKLKADLIKRIDRAHSLAQISERGRVVAVGLSVYEQGWAGIFCMHTRVEYRRKGLAREILGSLASWARDAGAEKMYLQVENNNPIAQQFYEASGFVSEYGYHYRTKETALVSQ